MQKNSFFVILVLSSLLIFSCKSDEKTVLQFEAMNTIMTVQLYGPNAQNAATQVVQKIGDLEKSISSTLPDSYISLLNRPGGQFSKTDEHTFYLLDYAKKMGIATDGALNIALYPVIKEWGFTTGDYKVPSQDKIDELLLHTDFTKINLFEGNQVQIEEGMQLDLGAVGKGYAGDLAVEVLKNLGIKSALLDLGGNIQALGTKSDGSPWKIGVKNPWGGEAVAGLYINNEAVITSGGYERFFDTLDGKRYIHIFDGKTGYPVENDLESVTIISESGLYADSLSTALFVMGFEGAKSFWEKHQDFQMILITKEHKIFYTPLLSDRIFSVDDSIPMFML